MNKPVDNFTLTIRGMRCGSCVAHVRKALMEATGVESATVDLAGRSATVSGHDIDPDDVLAAVREAGYEADPGDRLE